LVAINFRNDLSVIVKGIAPGRKEEALASVARPTSSVTTFVLATKENARTSQMKIKLPNV